MNKSRRIIGFAFIISTLLWLTITLYSFNYHLEIFNAMRVFDFSIEEFIFNIEDQASLKTKTIITINNPSTVEFTLLWVEQRVSVNDFYVGMTSLTDASPSLPTLIPPKTSRDVTISMAVDFGMMSEEIIELLLTPSEKTWQLLVSISLEGPSIVGTFSRTTAQKINTS